MRRRTEGNNIHGKDQTYTSKGLGATQEEPTVVQSQS
jgi:hypothetical protein